MAYLSLTEPKQLKMWANPFWKEVPKGVLSQMPPIHRAVCSMSWIYQTPHYGWPHWGVPRCDVDHQRTMAELLETLSSRNLPHRRFGS